MFEIPIEDFVFVLCTLIGGGLLLVTVLIDDILGGIFESFDIDIGGASLMPLLLSFVAMFGVGGLFATQVLDLHGGAAAVVGVLSGAVGAGLAFLACSSSRCPTETSRNLCLQPQGRPRQTPRLRQARRSHERLRRHGRVSKLPTRDSRVNPITR